VDVIRALNLSWFLVGNMILKYLSGVMIDNEVEHILWHKIVHVLFPDFVDLVFTLAQVILGSHTVYLILICQDFCGFNVGNRLINTINQLLSRRNAFTFTSILSLFSLVSFYLAVFFCFIPKERDAGNCGSDKAQKKK
jgi:hypothetical protein